jgi:hypothetical protein
MKRMPRSPNPSLSSLKIIRLKGGKKSMIASDKVSLATLSSKRKRLKRWKDLRTAGWWRKTTRSRISLRRRERMPRGRS